MNVEFSERLKAILKERKLKQVDVIALAQPYADAFNTKLTSSDLSQYIHGKTEPLNVKLMILAQALNVSEGWLLGLDVPMERRGSVTFKNLTAEDQLIIALVSKLDEDDRKTIIAILNSLLTNNPKYQDKT